jgi:pimeloyl-ACP methyl ester carboxylesterase
MRLMPRVILSGLALATLANCQGREAGAPEPTPTTSASLAPAMLDGPAQPGTLRPARCRFALPKDVREGVDVECGYLSVPERRDSVQNASGGRVLMLAVAIFHPPGGSTQADPVIYLSGGPGFSTLKVLRYQLGAFTDLVFPTGRDLVLFDQRGVGLSRPALDCPGFYELSRELLDGQIDGRPVSKEEISARAWQEVLNCQQTLAQVADLSAYNSAASADDIEDLRHALGAEQINLWGGSYGTRLALEVMRRHPAGVRSVVLDAVYPPDVDLYVEAPANYERALDALFAACAANSVCSAAYPGLPATFFEVVERLNNAPVNGEIEDFFTGQTLEMRMDGDTILALTFQLLYDSRLRYLLPGQIAAASRGDYTAFELAQQSMLRLTSLSSRGMAFSVQCHEELAFSSLESFQAEVSRFPKIASMYTDAALGTLSYRVCTEWGAGQADASANEPVSCDVPALVMAGEFDPITPPRWARHASDTLPHAYFYEYPGLGHGAAGVAECPNEMFVHFLEDPRSAPPDACIEAMR